MLLRFGVSNHKSIHSPQELTMVATSLRDEDEGLIACKASPSGKVVPAAVVYGANASGKSNLISALQFMRSAVLLSHSHGVPGTPPPRSPFALDDTAASSPSSYEIDFVVGGVRYFYEFSVGEEAFESEALFAFPSGRRQMLFDRKGPKEVSFGRGLKGRNRIIADLMRPNSLFISTALQNGHEELTRVAAFFQDMLLNESVSVPGAMISASFENTDLDEKTIRFLKGIGTGVTGFRRKKIEMSDKAIKMQEELDSLFARMFPDKKVKSGLGTDKTITLVELAHKNSEGEDVFFDPDDESAGTRRLLVLVSSVFRSLKQGSLMVVDELDASLHTQACEAIVGLFSNKSINLKGAQLIATTHDTNLMLSKFLRRDQIWFAEKDKGGATSIFPLSDIEARRGDNLEKGYLQGRFGAIPFAGSIRSLLSRI